jgi:hypothetical protein
MTAQGLLVYLIVLLGLKTVLLRDTQRVAISQHWFSHAIASTTINELLDNESSMLLV